MRQPNKKKKKTTPKRGQQLSDSLARSVSKGKMTYAEARKLQKERDDKVGKTKKVYKTVRTASKGLPSKRKSSKARFRIDRNGNKVAY